MRLVCQNCGNDHSAYFLQSEHAWDVFVREGEGGPSLKAEPNDCEETRYFMNKIGPVGRINEALKAFENLRARQTFDCADCGEDDCVRIIET